MNIVGLGYKAGVGKDTAADLLVAEFGFVKIAVADELKRVVKRLWPDFTREHLWGPSEMRNVPLPQYGGLTVRKASQHIGTEVARALDPDVWVRIALANAAAVTACVPGLGWRRYDAADWPDGPSCFYNTKREPKGIVIPDVRFLNEGDAIRAANGQVWCIDAEGASFTRSHPSASPNYRWREHSSENSMRNYTFDATLANHGSLEEFKTTVRIMMAVSGMLEEAGL